MGLISEVIFKMLSPKSEHCLPTWLAGMPDQLCPLCRSRSVNKYIGSDPDIVWHCSNCDVNWLGSKLHTYGFPNDACSLKSAETMKECTVEVELLQKIGGPESKK